jgi:methylated-DNA-protein-cysteine methyltransferase-like protein
MARKAAKPAVPTKKRVSSKKKPFAKSAVSAKDAASLENAMLPKKSVREKKANAIRQDGKPVFERVYEIVMRIPRGRVLTYGAMSDLLAGRLTPQGIGWALKALPEGSRVDKKTGKPARYTSKSVPWQRVINSKGGTSTHKIGDIPPDLQRQMLEAEGVEFDHEDKVDLKRYLWFAGLADLR